MERKKAFACEVYPSFSKEKIALSELCKILGFRGLTKPSFFMGFNYV